VLLTLGGAVKLAGGTKAPRVGERGLSENEMGAVEHPVCWPLHVTLINRHCQYHWRTPPINVHLVLPSSFPLTPDTAFAATEDVIDRNSPASEWADEVSTSTRDGLPQAAATGASRVLEHGRTSVQSLSVASLVARAGEGDGRAWEELVARFGGMIAATGRRYRLVPADIAELQQTTWLRLVMNLHKIEQPERVGGWLATTARRESLQLLRRASKYHGGADEMLANMPDAHSPEPDARPIAEERDAVLRAAWGRLKPRCQELLNLLVTDDPMGYKDLSQLLNMPIGSIGPTRARCLEHLRRLIAEEDMTAI
jgi:RNA polymerase sigma factor (sigma-70 family)